MKKDSKKPESNDVTIEVIGAQALCGPEANMSNPHCVVKDVKGLSGDKRYTSTATDAVNPMWNERIQCRFNYKLSAFKFKVNGSLGGYGFLSGSFAAKCKLKIDDFLDKAVTGEPMEIDVELPLKDKSTLGCCSAGTPTLPAAKLHVKVTVKFNIPVARPGVHISLPQRFQIGLAWEFKKKSRPIDLDASIVGLDHDEKVVDKVWYRNLTGFGGAIRHSGDDTTGEGSGDDETITLDMSRLPASVEKLAVVINSFTGQSLASVKFAYVRLIADHQTHGFYALGEGRVPDCTGLLFGVLQRRQGSQWEFITTATKANGRTVEESIPSIIAYGKQRLNW